VDLKSDIKNPRAVVAIEELSNYMTNIGFESTGKMLHEIIIYYLRAMFSYDRGSRKELEEILKAMGVQLNEEDPNNPNNQLRLG